MLGSRGRCWAQEAYEQGMVKSGSAVFMIGAAAFGLPLLLRTLGERKTIYFVPPTNNSLSPFRSTDILFDGAGYELRRARAVLGGGAGAADDRAAEPQHRQSHRAFNPSSVSVTSLAQVVMCAC